MRRIAAFAAVLAVSLTALAVTHRLSDAQVTGTIPTGGSSASIGRSETVASPAPAHVPGSSVIGRRKVSLLRTIPTVAIFVRRGLFL